MPPLTGKPEQQRFVQCEVAYWPALAVGSAAQLVAAHCPNERTLDLQSEARQRHQATLAFSHPQCSPATTHYES